MEVIQSNVPQNESGNWAWIYFSNILKVQNINSKFISISARDFSENKGKSFVNKVIQTIKFRKKEKHFRRVKVQTDNNWKNIKVIQNAATSQIKASCLKKTSLLESESTLLVSPTSSKLSMTSNSLFSSGSASSITDNNQLEFSNTEFMIKQCLVLTKFLNTNF